MLRITEIKLPLDHAERALSAEIIRRLGIASDDLVSYTVFRRSHDARKHDAIVFIYSVDVEVKNEPVLLQKFKNHKNIIRTPDMSYRFVTQAPAVLKERPIVIGTGPCGMFAG